MPALKCTAIKYTSPRSQWYVFLILFLLPPASALYFLFFTNAASQSRFQIKKGITVLVCFNELEALNMVRTYYIIYTHINIDKTTAKVIRYNIATTSTFDKCTLACCWDTLLLYIVEYMRYLKRRDLTICHLSHISSWSAELHIDCNHKGT